MSTEDIKERIKQRLLEFKKPIPAVQNVDDLVEDIFCDSVKSAAELVLEVTEKLSNPNNTNQYRIGIDPGVTGAITVHDLISDEYQIFDMPIFKVTKPSGKTRSYYDANGLYLLLSPYKGSRAYVEDLEAVSNMAASPGAPKFMRGSIANFSLGYGMGVIDGVCTALKIGVKKFRPADWKRVTLRGLGNKTDKDAVRQLAIHLFPHLYSELSRKMDHNRAESLLILTHGEQAENLISRDFE